MKTTRQLLYRKVQDARESCAGDSPKNKETLLEKITEAIAFASEVEAPIEIINKLMRAERIVREEKEFEDRLPADQILCGILNEDLKGEG